MDEDNSQDELINCSTSHKKGKRAALWTISDDSDDVDEEFEEEQTDSGDDDEVEEEEEHDDDDDDEEEEEDDDDEEEDAKTEEGAFGGTSADVPEISSDEDTEKCPICLNSFNSQPVATPENCEHYFCFDCILEWAKNVNSCPVDRIAFNSIYLRKSYGGKVKKMITVQKPVKAEQEEIIDVDLDETRCEVCGDTDREDRLLLCDGCDAGYHMECLTPPLDSVPVEEWFCPECEANNRHSRRSVEELSDTESIPSTARPATSRAQPRAAGPTRAIARTQQSERVRANVNRHRISQARTSQLAPTYLIQSTWLDDTINAVVAGLNTAVYVRDVAPRAPSGHRRKPGKRRKVKSKKTSSAKSKNGKSASTGVKRRRRRVRRTKSRKKLILKKTATPRSRIANNLRIVNDKKGSSLPTVYRPVEHTLSSMRADIGAASLSIYGDPFDLDPFVDREEEPEAHAISLLEAKRRGISRSALRSHQPVARPVTANLSRRGVVIPQTRAVVEAAPVPDLLGSILSGQSMLLMDSSDVVINRDGSLKAAKPMTPSIGKINSSGDASPLVSPGVSLNLEDSPLSLHYNGNLPGPSHTSANRLLNTNSSHVPSPISNHTHSTPYYDLPSGVNPSFQSPIPNRPTPPLPCQRGSNAIREPRETAISSVQTVQDSNFKSKEMGQSQSQPKKASTKPMWIDVSVLPRIPKIKRESSTVTNDASSHGGSYGSNSTVANSSRRRGSNSASGSSGSSVPEMSITSLSGDKGRQQSVDQQKGQANGEAQRDRPNDASSTSTFSNSFSSSSSGTPASHPQYASSSSSSAVSFRINSSGNSWHARRLNMASSSTTRGSVQEHWRGKEDDTRKKQLRKDKQMLLSSHVPVSKERDSNMYDPFNPTMSDSSSSDDEAKSIKLSNRPQRSADQRNDPSLEKKGTSELTLQHMVLVKTEAQEMEVSQEEAGNSQSAVSQERRISGDSVKVEQESRLVDETTAFFGTRVKKEPKLEDAKESESSRLVDETTAFFGAKVKKEPKLEDAKESESCYISKNYLNSELTETTAPGHHSLDLLKKEEEMQEGDTGHSGGSPNRSPLNHRVDWSAPGSANRHRKQKEEAKSDPTSCSKSPLTDLDYKKQAYKNLKQQHSSSSETERHRKEDCHASGQGNKKKERDKERSPRLTGSRDRRRAHSSSDSSQPKSPDRTQRKRRSQSKDTSRRRRTRSRSSSSSRERSRRKKQKQRSSERSYHSERDYEKRRVPKDKRRGRSRSKSRSKSRSRSRTRSRSKDRKRGASRSKSRSRSKERRQDDDRQQHASVSSRNKAEPRSKDKRRHKSRSSSRERKQPLKSSRNAQKMSGACISSSKDTNRIQGRKNEKDTTERNIKKVECAKIDKQELSSCSFSHQNRMDDKDIAAESQESEMTKAVKNEKEKQSCLEMSEDSSVAKIKKEKTGTPLCVSKIIDDVIEQPIKTESCESSISKTEPKSSGLCPFLPVDSLSTLTAPVTAHTHKDAASQSQLVSVDSCKQEDTVGVTVSVKQEPPTVLVKQEPPTVLVKQEPPTVSVKQEPPAVPVKQEPPAVPVKQEPPAVPVKQEPPAVPVKQEPPAVPVKQEPPAVPVKQEPPAVPVKQEPPTVPVKQEPPAVPVKQEPPAVPVKQEPPAVSVKQEPPDSDDDFSVDVMLDNLDYVISKHTEESGAAVKKEKEVEGSKDGGEQVSSVVGTKSKTQVKRVTWNIQEPEGPQPEKSASKVALYKLKLKQEGARRPSSVPQTSTQETRGDVSDAAKKGTVGLLSASSGSEVLHSGALPTGGQEEAEEGDLSKKDKQYLKKLHMQERAIEEVKLAIKPFYQRRDINKDEYKEILRKAVQKVCHSKSGEINPVKVGNLVKAYVEKYKHARKHKKGDDSGKVPAEQTEPMKMSDSP
ncbi:uncharacterized protein phrf1 [Xenentodon cancila]